MTNAVLFLASSLRGIGPAGEALYFPSAQPANFISRANSEMTSCQRAERAFPVADRSILRAHDSEPTRRVICQWAVLGVCSGFVAACKANDSTDGNPTPVASVITHTRRRRVFYGEFVAKRFGHPPREIQTSVRAAAALATTVRAAARLRRG